MHSYSVAPQMESLISQELLSFIWNGERLSNDLTSTFQRLPPVLDQLQWSFEAERDVSVRLQYRRLRQSVVHGVGKTIDFTDLLKGVQQLRQDQERWGRIDNELKEASRVTEGSLDKRSSCPHLYDLEEELKLRTEGVIEAREKVCSACRDIDRDAGQLLAFSGTTVLGVVNVRVNTGLLLVGLKLAKISTLNLATFGTYFFIMGLYGFFPEIKRALFGMRIPFGFGLLGCLYLGWWALTRTHEAFKGRKKRENETVSNLQRITSDLQSCTVRNLGMVVEKQGLVSEVREHARQFFSGKDEDYFREMEYKRNELQSIMMREDQSEQ